LEELLCLVAFGRVLGGLEEELHYGGEDLELHLQLVSVMPGSKEAGLNPL
jgi:hypothetical protein